MTEQMYVKKVLKRLTKLYFFRLYCVLKYEKKKMSVILKYSNGQILTHKHSAPFRLKRLQFFLMRTFILLFPLLLLSVILSAQTSSKTKSKDRFREKDDLRYPVRITNATEINKNGTDFAPSFWEGGLVFVSSRGKNGSRDPITGETYAKLYFSNFDPNGDPTPPSVFELDVNKKSDDMHEGPVSFSRDHKTVYYTRTNNKNGVRKAGKDGVSRFKIYRATYGVPDWDLKGELHFNSDEYNCLHPCLSPDGKRLFFTSDMPGGKGGYDLYYVERTDAGWSLPKNLGDVINTAGNELFPFYGSSNTLFFSSNSRTNTLGGLDIYYVNNPLEAPEEVVNLGSPFNSSGNDISYIMDEEGKNGFFASDRENGVGKQDIYRFMADRGIEGVTKPEVNALNITVTSARTGDPIQGASIRILLPTDDGFVGQANNEFYKLDLIPQPGKPNVLSFELKRKDADDLGKADHYSNASGKASTELTRYRPALILVSFPGYGTKERFIAVDKETDYNLSFALPDAPLCLRANGLVLTEKFGTRIGNALLRFINKENDHKTEIRTDINGQFSACLPEEGKYLLQVERDGFKMENFRLDVANNGREIFQEVRMRPLTEVGSVEETLPLASTLQTGSLLTMDEVFYEKNRSTLNQGAIRHLEALIDLMRRYPEMQIEVNLHTDARGNADQNMKLTKDQAKNVESYLEFREREIKEKEGLELRLSSRAKTFGRGDTEPRNECKRNVECTDEQHRKNNRIEVKVVKLGTLRP